MERDEPDAPPPDRLALTNTVTMSALVGLLVRKGILTEAELVSEIRRLRSRLESTER